MSRAVSRLLAPAALLAALLFMLLGPIATPGAIRSIATRGLVCTYDDSQPRTPSQGVSEAPNPTGTADRATRAIVDLHQEPGFAAGACVAAEDAGSATRTALERFSYPPNRGFLGGPVRTTLQAGERIDRYGYPGGTFVSPEGTLFEERSLLPTDINKPYNVYEVARPVDVNAGTAASWFGYGGGGIQYELPAPVADLLEQGILKLVHP